jgi:hypothetical protein
MEHRRRFRRRCYRARIRAGFVLGGIGGLREAHHRHLIVDGVAGTAYGDTRRMAAQVLPEVGVVALVLRS